MDKKGIKHWFEEHKEKLRELRRERRKLCGLPLSKTRINNRPVEVMKFVMPRWVRSDQFDEKLGPFQNGYSFGHKLEKKGFVKLGSGHFSDVYGHPKSERVIKVCRKADDDGWLDYIKWANENGYAGKFAPKVHSYKWCKKGRFGLAVMEKLDKTLYKCEAEHDARAINELLFMSIQNPLASTLLDLAAPGLPQFAKELAKTFGGGLDLHGGNIMVRADKSFVVSDPVGTKNYGYTGTVQHTSRLKFAA